MVNRWQRVRQLQAPPFDAIPTCLAYGSGRRAPRHGRPLPASPAQRRGRDTLHAWLAKRAKLPNSDQEPLFGSLKGQQLSARAIDLAVRHLGQHADVETSAHTLRHTCLTRLVRAGNDIVLVAELAEHSRLEATRRYSLPSDTDRQAAMDALTADY